MFGNDLTLATSRLCKYSEEEMNSALTSFYYIYMCSCESHFQWRINRRHVISLLHGWLLVVGLMFW